MLRRSSRTSRRAGQEKGGVGGRPKIEQGKRKRSKSYTEPSRKGGRDGSAGVDSRVGIEGSEGVRRRGDGVTGACYRQGAELQAQHRESMDVWTGKHKEG